MWMSIPEGTTLGSGFDSTAGTEFLTGAGSSPPSFAFLFKYRGEILK